MFDTLLKNKKALLIYGGIALVLIIIIWLIVGGSGNTTDEGLTALASDPVELILGREMLSSLDEMRAVKLDVSLFNNPVYQSLKDFSVEIPKQPIGRRDPFAPIGQSGL